MRINSLGWAVIVLALTLTIWNVMEYRGQMDVPKPDDYSIERWDWLMQQRQSHLLPKYVEREVLIIGAAVAAWLIVGRRERKA
ncbi:MAG: hypothetical protein WBX23_12090 [Candidatus Cybelea sp.]